MGSGGQSSEFCTDNSNIYKHSAHTHSHPHIHTLAHTHHTHILHNHTHKLTHSYPHTHTLTPSHPHTHTYLPRCVHSHCLAIVIVKSNTHFCKGTLTGEVKGHRSKVTITTTRPYIVEYALETVQILTWGDIVSFPDQNHPLCEKGLGDNRAFCPDL